MKDEEKIHFIQEIKLNYFFDDKPAVLETLIGKPINVYAKLLLTINISISRGLQVGRS